MKNKWDYLEKDSMSSTLQRQLIALNQDQNIDHELSKQNFKESLCDIIPKMLVFCSPDYRKIPHTS